MVTISGTVIAAGKLPKTIKVAWRRLRVHSEVGKLLRQRISVAAHDAQDAAAVGDRVLVQALTRPVRSKNWALVGVVARHADLAKVDGLSVAARVRRAIGGGGAMAPRHETIQLQLPRPIDAPRGSRLVRY